MDYAALAFDVLNDVMKDDAIIALGSDGFTVDDNGNDSHPNTNGQVYFYLVFGAE